MNETLEAEKKKLVEEKEASRLESEKKRNALKEAALKQKETRFLLSLVRLMMKKKKGLGSD